MKSEYLMLVEHEIFDAYARINREYENLTTAEPAHDFPELHMPCLSESILLKKSVTM